jgi:ribosomal protein L31
MANTEFQATPEHYESLLDMLQRKHPAFTDKEKRIDESVERIIDELLIDEHKRKKNETI